MNTIRFCIFVRTFIFAILLVCLCAPHVTAEKQIVLIGSQDTKNSFHGRWLALIYTEVFNRLGYEFIYQGSPSDLASRISDAGRVDGEINRVSMYQKTHPTMIRVDEPHFSTILAAYAVKPGIVLEGWESLKEKPYRIEYRRGTRIAEANLGGVVAPERLTTVATTAQGLKRLIVGRIDIFVDVKSIVFENFGQLDPHEFNHSSIYQAGVMARDTLHLYLHRKNADLVPKVNLVLKALKKEGLVEQYRLVALGP